MRRRSRYRRAVDRGDVAEEIRREAGRARPDAVASAPAAIFTSSVFCPRLLRALLVFGEGQYFRPLVFSKEQWKTRDRREAGLLLVSPRRCPAQALASIAPVARTMGQGNPPLLPQLHFRVQLAGRVGAFANEAIIFLQLGLAAAISRLGLRQPRESAKWPRRVAPPGPGYPSRPRRQVRWN